MTSRPLRLRALLILFAASALAACTGTGGIIRSPNDDRAYQHLTLDNGLSVLLVSDAGADKAAAALAVGTGQFEDPVDRGGLAHFLEHMLFLGTGKYPETDAYQSYISTHGGSHNAYTAGDHTNYFFDIQPDYFEGALDRFAQFFISPRFDAAYVEREKNAVNSEYQLYFNDDGWRGFHVSNLAMNPAHPGSRFHVGSLETLAGDVRSDLIEHYQAHYSADRMSLVVLGPQPLTELRDWVASKFAAVPRHATAPRPELPAMFAPGRLPAEIAHQTIKDTRTLTYNFPVPGLDPYYRQKPGDFISNLLGHEGEGSLHAVLKARGWIESLGASASRFDDSNALITVSIELTPAGETHVPDITTALFDAIELIRRDGLERWRYEEQARVAGLAFEFEEKQSPMRTVYRLAPDLQLYPAQDVLAAPYLMTRYDESLIARYLDALTPRNLLVEIGSRAVEGRDVEPWFKVPYRLDPLEIVDVPGVQTAGLALPAPNPFLPDRLDLIGDVEETPTQIRTATGLALWLSRDTSFGAPRANTYLELAVAGGFTSVEDALHANLYARLVQDSFNAFAYPAEIAGLSYDLSANGRGFRLAIAGFDDKQALLLERLLESFATLEVDAGRLALYREELGRELTNFASERPFQQASAALSHLLVENAWPPSLLASRIESVTVESLKAWRRARLPRFNVTGLLHGNVESADVDRVARVVTQHLPLAALPDFEPRIERLPTTLRHGLEIDNDDASLVCYLQGDDESIEERALFGLAAQILSAPYFNELRTEQQLGYVVYAGPALMRRLPGIAFTVQSPVAGPDALLGATLEFLEGQRQAFVDMPATEFAAHKASLISKLLERDKNLADRGARLWSDLDLGFTRFDSRQQIAAAVESIDAPAYLAFYDALLARAERNRLVVYSEGRFETAPAGTEISDVPAFKQGVNSTGSPAGTPAAQPAANAHSAG